MVETWLPFLIRRAGPPSKQGYAGASSRTLDMIEGEVKHSAEGSRPAAFHELDRLDRDASWTITVDVEIDPVSGLAIGYQHYPLESITWHAGLPGDRRHDTSLIGNITLIGIEHVDRVNGVQLTQLLPGQVALTAKITRAIRDLCPAVKANPPTLRRNLWEHNWLSSTACPSNLIPWDVVVPLVQEEPDDMFTDADRNVLAGIRARVEGNYVKTPNRDTVYLYDGRQLIAQSFAAFTEGEEGAFIDVRTVPSNSELWNMPTLYPLGVPQELR